MNSYGGTKNVLIPPMGTVYTPITENMGQ